MPRIANINYFIIAAMVGLIFGGFLVFAQEDDPFADIVYPVVELNNCQNKDDCQNYCDKPENMESCLDFAEEHGLISEEEIAMARKMLEAGETSGPGGCQGQAECEVYCDDISHIRECIAFAEEHDLIPPEELAEAKKVADAIDRGVTPPPCNSKSECDIVCRQPENMRVCLFFAKEAGLMPPEEQAEAEKVLAAIEKGAIPPPCGGRDACDAYCSEPEHLDECLTFAEAAGFMSPEEAEMVKRTGGKGPGDCRGKEQCEAFCEDPANAEPCIDFAEEFGFMSHEEAEQSRKMMAAGVNIMQGGPGGCKGKEECEAFCDDVSHMAECVDFAERAGMMSPEDAARARKMAEMGINMMGGGGPGGCKGEEECRAFCDDPTNLEECMNFAVQIGDMSPEEAEQVRQGMQMRAQMTECLAMPCSEALACLESLSPGGPKSEEGASEQGDGEKKNDEVQAKIESCMQEMMEPEMPISPERRMMSPEGMMPSEEIIEEMREEMINEEIQEQIQQQIQQQMEQMRGEPQSFFDLLKIFLASLLPF